MTFRFASAALAACALALVLSPAARAQDAAGDWHGKLILPTGELRIGVAIKPKAEGGFEGALLSPDQTEAAIPIDDIKADGGALSFAIRRIGATYQGRWDPAQRTWVGTFHQGVDLPLVLAAGKPEALGLAVIAGLDGDWGAEIPAANGARPRLLLHVRTGRDGTVATLDSPDQLAYGVAVRSLAREGQAVRFAVAAARVTFEGALSADGRSVAGTWTGPLYTGPLTFTSRPVETAAARRPQTPKPPFPYRAGEVVVDSAPGVRLAGTLTLPKGQGPFPAVVMITGSGAQDRDETIFGHKPFAVIADRLTRDGIAVLRVDDRGFAQSTGNFAAATDDDFAIDAAANVAFLRHRPDIDPARIGLIGHSEGGLVAPKVAARDPRLAFIVLMAGPGVPLGEVLRLQRAKFMSAAGMAPDQIQTRQALVDRALLATRGAKDDAEARARVRQALKDGGGDSSLTDAQVDAFADQLGSRWMRDLLDYDPRPTLAKVRRPILALNGSKDLQVPPEQNLPAIRQATRANPDVAVVELPDLNHLFQTAKTGGVGEYADIEETVAPIALDAMSDWIRRHVGR